MRRSDQEDAARRLVPLLTIAAAGFIILGIVLLALPTRSLFISFAALFCIVVGGAFLTPAVLVAVMRLVEPLLGRLFGIIGRMAPRAVERTLSSTDIAVVELTISDGDNDGDSVMI